MTLLVLPSQIKHESEYNNIASPIHILITETLDQNKTYNDVQFSVQSDGFVGELGPPKVSPHLIPLHVFICKFEFDEELQG